MILGCRDGCTVKAAEEMAELWLSRGRQCVCAIPDCSSRICPFHRWTEYQQSSVQQLNGSRLKKLKAASYSTDQQIFRLLMKTEGTLLCSQE